MRTKTLAAVAVLLTASVLAGCATTSDTLTADNRCSPPTLAAGDTGSTLCGRDLNSPREFRKALTNEGARIKPGR